MTPYGPGDPGYQHLFGVAYRLLGSAQDAEDAIQEGQIRWQQLPEGDRELIREPLAWLTRVVSRICLDQLGSARARREQYAGIWLPEPLPGRIDPLVSSATARDASDPADAVTLGESVSMALLVVMEKLSPGERVALILHDVFGVPFGEIATIVDRSPEACRQLASAGRRHVRSGPRFSASGPERDGVVAAFARACMGGDLMALAQVLDPNVVSRADGGGIVPAGSRPIHGVGRVARLLAGLGRRGVTDGLDVAWRPALVNGQMGLVVEVNGALVGVVDLAVRDGRVVELATVVNPDKLTRWNWGPLPEAIPG